MNTQPSSSPQTDPPPAAVQLSQSDPPPAALPVAAEAAPSGGARKLSRWEELEQVWFPEPNDYTHSGINE